MVERKRAEDLEDLATRAVDTLTGEDMGDAAQALVFAGATLARQRMNGMDDAERLEFIRQLADGLIRVSGVNEGRSEKVSIH